LANAVRRVTLCFPLHAAIHLTALGIAGLHDFVHLLAHSQHAFPYLAHLHLLAITLIAYWKLFTPAAE